MIRLTINKRFIDAYAGDLSLVTPEGETKLAEVVMREGTMFRYKGKPRDLDGRYLLKYATYNEEGFQFRPLLDHKTLEFRFARKKDPTLTSRDVIYIVQKKKVWEEKCRRLFSRGEHLLEVVGYDHRDELPQQEERYFQEEDYTDLEGIDDEDFY